MSRRQRFKEYISRVAAAARPTLALEQRLYVHPPNAVSDLIVGHLELDPASRHLVVGSIGAGKTTQLLVAADKINALGDIRAVYIDVSERQDLVKLRPGCLVALAGLALLENEPAVGDSKSRQWFTNWAKGYWADWTELISEQDDGSSFVKGAVTAPSPEWADIDAEQVERLAEFHDIARKGGRHFVVLFDSLDRTTTREAFAKLVEQDIAAFKRCNIGVVLIGPIRSLEGFGRLDADRFDKLHLQSPIDVDQDGAGKEFLFRVLRARADSDLLPDEAALALVAVSGGVLRDLISIAKAAGDEAYLRGAERIEVSHVLAAADSFGRSLMIGLRRPEIETLKHLRASGGFVSTSDDDLALLATRRILEYPHRAPPYAVHPTIAPLLEQKAS